MTTRLVVMVSGSGSNLQAILDACDAGNLDAEVVAVVSDRVEAFALQRAAAAQVDALVVERQVDQSRETYDRRLAGIVAGYEPTFVVLAGWMRLLSPAFLDRLDVINLHPALPGEFPGLDAIERAFAAWEEGSSTRSGVMVHWVPDAGVDSGPVIAMCEVPFESKDTCEVFAERMHAAEHELLVHALGQVFEETAV